MPCLLDVRCCYRFSMEFALRILFQIWIIEISLASKLDLLPLEACHGCFTNGNCEYSKCSHWLERWAIEIPSHNERRAEERSSVWSSLMSRFDTSKYQFLEYDQTKFASDSMQSQLRTIDADVVRTIFDHVEDFDAKRVRLTRILRVFAQSHAPLAVYTQGMSYVANTLLLAVPHWEDERIFRLMHVLYSCIHPEYVAEQVQFSRVYVTRIEGYLGISSRSSLTLGWLEIPLAFLTKSSNPEIGAQVIDILLTAGRGMATAIYTAVIKMAVSYQLAPKPTEDADEDSLRQYIYRLDFAVFIPPKWDIILDTALNQLPRSDMELLSSPTLSKDEWAGIVYNTGFIHGDTFKQFCNYAWKLSLRLPSEHRVDFENVLEVIKSVIIEDEETAISVHEQFMSLVLESDHQSLCQYDLLQVLDDALIAAAVSAAMLLGLPGLVAFRRGIETELCNGNMQLDSSKMDFIDWAMHYYLSRSVFGRDVSASTHDAPRLISLDEYLLLETADYIDVVPSRGLPGPTDAKIFLETQLDSVQGAAFTPIAEVFQQSCDGPYVTVLCVSFLGTESVFLTRKFKHSTGKRLLFTANNLDRSHDTFCRNLANRYWVIRLAQDQVGLKQHGSSCGGTGEEVMVSSSFEVISPDACKLASYSAVSQLAADNAVTGAVMYRESRTGRGLIPGRSRVIATNTYISCSNPTSIILTLKTESSMDSKCKTWLMILASMKRKAMYLASTPARFTTADGFETNYVRWKLHQDGQLMTSTFIAEEDSIQSAYGLRARDKASSCQVEVVGAWQLERAIKNVFASNSVQSPCGDARSDVSRINASYKLTQVPILVCDVTRRILQVSCTVMKDGMEELILTRTSDLHRPSQNAFTSRFTRVSVPNKKFECVDDVAISINECNRLVHEYANQFGL